VARWHRAGGPTQFGAIPNDSNPGVGWSWTIARQGDDQRLVLVEVSGSPFLVTDLPAEARNAIRSRGATAVDLYLHLDEPPTRIVVSKLGVRVGVG
jgi:hypothetical protein